MTSRGCVRRDTVTALMNNTKHTPRAPREHALHYFLTWAEVTIN